MSTMRFFKRDSIVSKEGEVPKAFYVLVDGKVAFFKGNKKVGEFDKAGEIFGELAMILKKPRTAALITLADSNLLAVEGELDEIMKAYPDIAKKLIKTLAERLDNHSKGIK